MRSGLFFVAMAAALFLAALALRAPGPQPADIPAHQFSASRAMEDIRVIAARPHPIGAVDAARVRAYLFSRMTALGLSPRLGLGQGTFSLPARRIFVAGRVVNFVGLLSGTQGDLPAILIMAHYDTVPNSPGAADDTAGVASALEIVANLNAAGPRLRDVIVLFTDGEEAGLLGSDAFFARDPLARRVGLVINLEARGGGGRAMMFETNGKVGGIVSAYGRAAPLPSANSLAAFVYRHMPNGTDFTNAARRGLAGLNFAYIGDELDYHTAHATPENIDPGSVQHMGDSVLGLVAQLSHAREYPNGASERVYADILGHGFVAYPVWGGWLIIGASIVLIALAAIRWRREGALRAGDVLRGVGLFLCVTVGVGAGLGLIGWLMLGFSDVQMKYTLLARYGFVLGGYVALATGLALSVVAAFLGVSFLGRTATPEALWCGGLLLLVVAAAGLQVVAPTTAFMVAWPLLVGSLAAAAPLAPFVGQGARAFIVATVIGALGAGQAAEWGGQIFGALGVNVPALLTVQAAIISILLWPSVFALARASRAWAAPAALITLGGIAVLYARFAPADAAHPRLTEAFYTAGPGPQDFNRIADFPRLDEWSMAALEADGGEVQRDEFQPFLPMKVWAVAAKPASVAQPEIAVVRAETRGGRRFITLRLTPTRGGRELRLFLKPNVDLGDAVLNGQPLSASVAAGVWTGFGYAAPPGEGVTLSFSAAAPGRIEAKLAEVADGWPEGAKVPPKPAGFMPWRYSDVTVGLTDFSTAW
ncbi:M20/M25/M40 family metallo-hydrolase [Parvibaculum sedimenti]|uniref:Vacuolar membrane protease n=1 Tax=Parvibaculum sedimenti TaxID=2608632 RepID=A0A6N6VFA8_9HYPH|nr:M20/M25/M40 family metallo-hydrolase [Parvibaculum sedimenti]KAB7739299.1 M20/M25/M40 family metallo-hydrolase [Parvibaculum sedimenti]